MIIRLGGILFLAFNIHFLFVFMFFYYHDEYRNQMQISVPKSSTSVYIRWV